MERATSGWLPRFPWTQLVFCLACLSMAAWTWMRYSYAWEFRVEDLVAWSLDRGQGQLPDRLYVRFRGAPYEEDLAEAKRWGHVVYGDPGCVCSLEHLKVAVVDPHNPLSGKRQVHVFGSPFPTRDQKPHWVEGRFHSSYLISRGNLVLGWSDMRVETPVPRLAQESVGGIAVGAMGVFIFGLYLRRWLRERYALAGGPERDIIT